MLLSQLKKYVITTASLILIAGHMPIKVHAQEPMIPLNSSISIAKGIDEVKPYDFEDFDYQEFLDEMVSDIKEETGEEISATLDQNSNVVISYYNENNEQSEMVLNPITSEATIDGVDYGEIVETETFVDQSKVQSEMQTFSREASSAWTPVYYSTTRNSVAKVTGQLSKASVYAALVIAAVAGIASGTGITVPALLAQAKVALSSLKLAGTATIVGDVINVKWSTDTYRTKGLVSKGGNTYKQYAYRYQNTKFSAKLKVGKLTSREWVVKGKTGAWWFASKPF